jgi:protein gp37
MGSKTKIEWADATWNPVTGCKHRCEYCYARSIANRFKGWNGDAGCVSHASPEGCIYELERQPERTTKSGQAQGAPFPFDFEPTLHRYRLEEPQHWKDPKTIFVCSMADLFGEWVPDEWIETVFSACRAAPQHRYLFLTKNPVRYLQLAGAAALPAGEAFWYGTTVTGPNDIFWWSKEHNTFASIEPMLQPFGRSDDEAVKKVGWVVMGAMTGPGAKDHQPEPEWVMDIIHDADTAGVPILMKDSLRTIVGEANMRRDFPWEVSR